MGMGAGQQYTDLMEIIDLVKIWRGNRRLVCKISQRQPWGGSVENQEVGNVKRVKVQMEVWCDGMVMAKR